MSNTVNPADNMYNQYSQWNKDAAPAIFKAETETEFAQANEQAGIFDFQQGQDYTSSLHKLALGELNAADADQNGLVDYEEFVEQGKNEYRGILSEDTIKELEDNNSLLLQFWAKDLDIDDQISTEDLELFYSIADESLPSEENKRIKDGKFSQDDLAKATDIMLNMLEKENPELEQDLADRSEELYQAQKGLKKQELKKIIGFDINKDKEVDMAEFMIGKENTLPNGSSPEAKAGAYCVYEIMSNVIGDDFDKKGTLDLGDIGMYLETQYDSGFNGEEYYNFLLENFTGDNASAQNHEHYQQVLEYFKSQN